MKPSAASKPSGKRKTSRFQVRHIFILLGILAGCLGFIYFNTLLAHLQVQTSPGDLGPCTPTTTSITYEDNTYGEITFDLHYPTPGSCTDGQNAPYPVILFAHGFTMFGITPGMLMNQGNGEHLASWGYVTAIPRLPDDVPTRLGVLLDVLDYLRFENMKPLSFLFRMLDMQKIGTVGHSLGGATALAAAAHDSRIKATVGLDPVFQSGSPFEPGEIVWDPYLDGPDIIVPTAIFGTPPDPCNADGNSQIIYPLIGADQKAYYFFVGANHNIFADPSIELIDLFCGGDNDPSLTTLSQKIMTAWFNYYLKNRLGDYTYIYGGSLMQDIQDGLLEVDFNKVPGLAFLPIILR